MSRKKSVLAKIRNSLIKYVKIPRDYIQMSLPVEKITKEFEMMVKNKVQHFPVQAKIREATRSDIDSILKIYDRAWHSTSMPYNPLSKTKLSRLLKNKNFIILIAEIGDIDGAFVIIHITGENNDVGIIGILAVIPELQHKGLGTSLGLACWDYLKKKEVNELRCQVYSANRASYIFLRSLGFKEIYDDEKSKYFFAF